MTERMARRLSRYLVREGHADPEKRELLEYGIFHIVSTIFHVLMLLAAGFIFGILPGVAAYSVCFCSLKRYIGGAHASTHWACLWGFTGAALAGAALGLMIAGTVTAPYAPVVLTVVTLALILWRAPVIHPNAPKNSKEKLRRFKGRALAIAAVQLAAVSLCAALRLFPELCACGSVGGLCASVTLLLPLPHITGKGGMEHEDVT